MSGLHLVAVFPGQGAQYPGMAKSLLEHFPWTKQIFEEASDAIKFDLHRLCVEGDAESLQLTHNAQPSILVTSYSWFEVLRRELDFHPQSGGGHSLGEYTALVAARALDLPTAVRLVRKRGELMQTAVPQGKGKMCAVIGMTDENVEALCGKASQGDTSLVVPANYNAPMQVVIAGHTGAVERAETIAKSDTGALKARKMIPLNVSAPFHCPLMRPVAQEFGPYLRAASWSNARFPVVSNVDAKLRSEGDFAGLLTEQIDHPVRWTQCVQSLGGDDAVHFVEMGPSKVLTGLIKRILDEATTSSIDSKEEFQGLEGLLKDAGKRN